MLQKFWQYKREYKVQTFVKTDIIEETNNILEMQNHGF